MTTMSMIPLSLTLLSLLSTALAEPVHLPMMRQVPAVKDRLHYLRTSQSLMARYNRAYHALRSRDTQGVQDVTMVSDQGVAYTVTLLVGTPGQAVPAALDTTTSALWMVTPQCSTCGSNAPAYQPALSSSSQVDNSQNTTLPFGAGTVAGPIITDTVKLGGLVVSSQAFVGVSSIAGRQLTVGASALVGIGLDTIGVSANSPNFVQQGIAETNVQGVAAPEIGLCPSRLADNPPNVTTNSGNSSSVFGGFISFGKANSTLYTGAPENYTIAGDNTTWSIHLTSVTVAGVSISSPATATLDINTPLLGGPTNDVKAIFALIPGSQPIADMPGYFSIACANPVNISITIEGQTSWPVDPRDIISGPLPGDSSRCVATIFDMGPDQRWVLGGTFLKNVYTILRMNPPSVGIAPLSPLALSFNDGKVPIPGQGPATTVSGAPAVKTSGAAKASNDATSHPRQFSSAIFPMILLAFLLPI